MTKEIITAENFQSIKGTYSIDIRSKSVMVMVKITRNHYYVWDGIKDIYYRSEHAYISVSEALNNACRVF